MTEFSFLLKTTSLRKRKQEGCTHNTTDCYSIPFHETKNSNKVQIPTSTDNSFFLYKTEQEAANNAGYLADLSDSYILYS